MHQKWFWSGWYNIIVPLFLSGLGIIIFTQTDENSWYWTYIAIGITIGFLLVAGGLTIIRTIRGWRRTGKVSYIYRHQFSLIVYAMIFAGILYELPPRWNESTIIPPIDAFKDYIDIVYIPITSILLLLIPIVVLIIMIQPFISLFTHKIDFAPVFVYLKQKGSDWKVTKVRYDKFHHDVATCEKKELKRYLIKNKRVKLAVPNTWHSMTTTRGLGRIISFFGLLGFILCYIALAGLFYLYPEAVEGMDLIAIIVALSLLCAYAFFALNQTKLQKQFSSHDLRDQGLILNPEKLAILWNLVGEAPSLKIGQKFQDPFNPDPMFWNSFFDLKSEKTIFVELKATRERTGKIISFFLGTIAVLLTIIGFYIGGFWEHSLGQLQTPNSGWIIAFLLSFGVALLAFLIYTAKLKPKSLLIILIVTALFAWIDEAIFTYGNLWNYLDGEPVRLAFAVFGWPVFVILIIGLSNWILKYINLPEYRGGFVTKIMNFIPVLVLLGIFGVLFVVEGGIDEVLNIDDTTIQVLIMALIALILVFSILFGLTHTFKQNLVVMIVAMIVGGMMESLGNLCGYWTHFSFTPILPEIAPSLTPIFLVILWAFRVLTLLFIARILRQNILRSD
jgi:MFS family permease